VKTNGYLDLAERAGRMMAEATHLIAGIAEIERMTTEVGIQTQSLARLFVLYILCSFKEDINK